MPDPDETPPDWSEYTHTSGWVSPKGTIAVIILAWAIIFALVWFFVF